MDGRSKIRWQHRLKREHPTCTERTKSLNEECGWKGGDSGDSAGEKPCPMKQQKNPLDSDRPSHGRRLHSKPAERLPLCRSRRYNEFSTCHEFTYRTRTVAESKKGWTFASSFYPFVFLVVETLRP